MTTATLVVATHPPAALGPPVIELAGVEKSFGKQHVLRGVDLVVEAGMTTVIVGPSGEGKSVILKHMLGLLRPDRGAVRLFGQDLAHLRGRRLREVRSHFGVLFQSVALFDSLTVFDNVALPLRERTTAGDAEVRRRVLDRLERMDLHDVEHKFPAQLSGGMQKRVGLARALVLDPDVVFFDEPTTGLDAARTNEIYRLFYRSQKALGYAAVIVSHDVPKIFKLADRVVLLAGGVLHGGGSAEAFQRSTDPVVRRFVETTMGHLYISDLEEGMTP
ncbi:MAG: ABC transporter ATP-binding protein [Nitrospirae bacterium CG18_big_fil_WC_8_21_14_2_50_70_55]|nr:ATP-binding cassette domain-containing protein [Deltaproteobacteria bacterium]OIP61798.1 MAG: ABC transporter ATP-binding protein [Nitrospirae bacterium CG2_30_70_394]PIQ04201.1 MAG: ABC transporter ATP-binding protein [Nitrospirae bacterium CG18_big_fil_WC_8_21_14_2_50_70_55]PIU79808.1 MAG: ABC transporter ATP-binding protein [Nitrospirae bacterium CG06_land_8_20_14_3_00_70_43]PIW82610.1 MAG: ABC transporter ATP-binding protein [Nitrospirae bacterium CG_4_8_14_3_um_filter_70_85]PIX83875.1 